MPTSFFTGFTEPKILGLTVPPLPAISFLDPSSGIAARYTVSISANSVCVKIDTETDVLIPEQSLYDHSKRLVRAAVDLFSFRTGFVVHVHLDEFTDSKGAKQSIVVQHRSLSDLCSAFDNVSMRDVYRMIAFEQETFFALSDLIVAVSVPEQAASNCAKVLDTIRRIIDPAADKVKGWSALQAALNADANYLRYITDASKNPRHGDRSYISADVLMESIRRTWTIMNRLFEYKKRNGQSLPLGDFPLLRG